MNGRACTSGNRNEVAEPTLHTIARASLRMGFLSIVGSKRHRSRHDHHVQPRQENTKHSHNPIAHFFQYAPNAVPSHVRRNIASSPAGRLRIGSEARVKIARMTLTIQPEKKWRIFQLVSNDPPSLLARMAPSLGFRSRMTATPLHDSTEVG